jgi:hypothetical protein
MEPVASTAVGKRGTSPVSKYVMTIGMLRMIAVPAKPTKIAPKNGSGLSSFIRSKIIQRIRMPSR